MIFSNNERVFIHDLSNLTVPIIFNGYWASMNEGLKCSIAWNDSRHAPWWQFNLNYLIEEIGIPVIICIVCRQVPCHPAEHVTSSMWNHLMSQEHIAKLHELTESESTELTSSIGDEPALAMLKR